MLSLAFAVILPAVLATADAEVRPASFRADVAPILAAKCLGCHNAKKKAGGLEMTTFTLLRRGGKSAGAEIVAPGDPEASALIESIVAGAEPRMPYKLPPLKDGEIALLKRWVKEGARFDGPDPAVTPIASLVDPLAGLPRIAPVVPPVAPIAALAVDAGGSRLAAAEGQSVVVYEGPAWKPAATLAGHPAPLTAVAFTPDGKHVVAAGGRPGMFGTVTVWDLEMKARRFDLRGHRDAILGAAVSPDGRLLATASYDRDVVLWDLAAGTPVRTLKDHTDAVYAVAFAPDGKTLASAGADRTVKLWDVATGRRLKTLSDATAELYAVIFSRGGETLLAAGVDRSIRAWRVADKDAPLAASVFAHDGAVLRLAVSADGRTLASSGEDRAVKLWELPSLAPRAALGGQSDWPQGLAINADGSRIAVGRYDGSLSWYDAATGKAALALKTANAPPGKPASGPQLVRPASLNALSPRGVTRGSKVRLTLTGNAVGRSTSILFAEPGLAATIVRPARSAGDPNRLEVDLVAAPDARPGIHRLSVVTPLGVPPFQPLAVSADPEALEAEPNDAADRATAAKLPAALVGTIARPGDVDHFRIHARRGQDLVFQVVARPLGSALVPMLTLLDERGEPIAETAAREGAADPVLTARAPRDGTLTLRVADADYAGSARHFYRITAGALPLARDVFPLGVECGGTAAIHVAGANLGPASSVTMSVSGDTEPGTIRDVPLPLPEGAALRDGARVVVAEGTQGVESEPNDEPGHAGRLDVPGGVSGRIARDGDADLFRFRARKGERLVLEVFGRRLATAIDPVIEVLDAKGRPVPRAELRPVDQTEVAFRDHDASKPGIRLTRWNNLAINDYVLIGRELARVEALPRNPDDDCLFWSEQNQRIAFLGTTTEHHPMSQPIYRVEIHPPGTVFPPGGVSPVTLTYRNDDGGPSFAKDSRVTFDPPADGEYLVRVEDVRGLGGDRFGYHLVVRRPRPDFELSVSAENPGIPRGGTALVTVSVARIDGFAGPVDVSVEGLPPGVSATSARVAAGQFKASLALSAETAAPAFSPPTWRLVARAAAEGAARSADPDLVHALDPGGPVGGVITVLPAANLEVSAQPGRVAIRPGQRVSMRLSVHRAPAFRGRVPINVQNLPQGVRVLNIGLNGVLITEKQTERTIFLYAEPWVVPVERPFYAVGKAETAGTEHSSPPIWLVVSPPEPGTQATARADGR